MVYENFEQLIESRIAHGKKKKTVALVCADEDHALAAVMEAGKKGIVKPLLIAEEEKLKPVLEPYKDYCDYEIIPVGSEDEALQAMVDAVSSGRADAIMKGLIQTGDLMRAVVSSKSGLRTGSLMSGMVVVKIPTYHKLLCVTDPGLVTYPDVEQKKQMINNAVGTLLKMGFDEPKVAVLAAVDRVNPKMPESLDGLALKELNSKGEIPGCIVEGPISYDLAVHKESAEIKGYESPVAGDADVLLCHNIAVANSLVKSLVFSAGGTAGAVVVGAKVPIVLPSRAASTEEKFHSLVLAASLDQDQDGDQASEGEG